MPSQATTLTLFFCGSGNNMSEYKQGKFVIPTLFKYAKGRHRGFDGVGGNNKDVAMYQTNKYGEYVYNGQHKIYCGPKPKTKKKLIGKSISSGVKTGDGSTSGRGTNAIAERALTWICDEIIDPTKGAVDRINMVGHSRGAVTAVMVAYGIKKVAAHLGKQIEVNLVLSDPVAGGANEFDKCFDSFSYWSGNKTRRALRFSDINPDRHTLPSNVVNFTAIIAGFIGKPGFGLTLPAKNGQTNYDVYCLPGDHNTAMKHTRPAGKIGQHLCYEFLTNHGSQITDQNFSMTGTALCETYAAVHKKHVNKKGGYHTSQGRAAAAEKYNTHYHGKNDYSKFYVNKHHEKVFGATFQAANGELRAVKCIGTNTAATMLATAPDTYSLLDDLGFLVNG